MTTKYLITGGCGFIGSYLATTLISQGAFVRILDNLSTGKREKAPLGAEVVVGYEIKDGKFHLWVADNGKGISLEHLKQIYVPFFTTKVNQGGLGVGMSIVHGLVTHSLRGTIECESELGKGSCFKVVFPV